MQSVKQKRAAFQQKARVTGILFQLPKPAIKNRSYSHQDSARSDSALQSQLQNKSAVQINSNTMQKILKLNQKSLTAAQIAKIAQQNMGDKSKITLIKQALYNKYKQTKTTQLKKQVKTVEPLPTFRSKIEDKKFLDLIISPRRQDIRKQLKGQNKMKVEKSSPKNQTVHHNRISLPQFNQTKTSFFLNTNKYQSAKNNENNTLKILYNTIFTQITSQCLLSPDYNEKRNREKLKLAAAKIPITDKNQSKTVQKKRHLRQTLNKLDHAIKLQFRKLPQEYLNKISGRTKRNLNELRGWDEESNLHQYNIFPQQS